MARVAAIIRRRKRLGGGGSVPVELVAPVLTHSDRIVDDLPDFSIALTDPVVGDVVTLRRSSTSNFASYEDATCAIDSLSPLTTLTFNYGSGEWAAQTWYTKAFFTRNGSESPHSNTESFTLEADGLELDFVNNLAFVRDTTTAANVYTGAPFSKLTFTRASAATYINSAGVITSAATDVARIDYNPSTLVCRGFLAEEARTNLLLNSLIDGTNLSTQGVSVTAQAYTLSFYGTGTITLSGASTAGPLVGTGVYPNRVSLTFTPSAGTLTCTVSGTVQYAQLEAGAFPTSFIPTAGASATRALDVATILTSAFKTSATEWTTLVEATPGVVTQTSDATNRVAFALSNNSFNESNYIFRIASANALSIQVIDNNVQQTTLGTPAAAYNTTFKLAFAVKADDIAYSKDGGAAVTDTSATLPTIDRLFIGVNWTGSGNGWCGHIRKLVYVPRRMTNAELQAVTA